MASDYSQQRRTWQSQQLMAPSSGNQGGLIKTSNPDISFALEHTSAASDGPKARADSYPKKGTVLIHADLTEEEQRQIEMVLNRYERSKTAEESRINSLKTELVSHRRSQIIKQEDSSDTKCASCNRLFVPLFNPAVQCVTCKKQFCRMCVDTLPKTRQIVCKSCRFENAYRVKLGSWFTEKLLQARAEGRVRGVSGPDALRTSLDRITRESKSKLRGSGETLGHSTPSMNYQGQPDFNLPQLPAVVPNTPFGSGAIARERDAQQLMPPQYPTRPMGGSALDMNYPTGRRTPDTFRGAQPGADYDTGSMASMESGMSGSTTSMFSGRESNFNHGVPLTGEVQMIITYDHPGGALRILIKQARGLAPVDTRRGTASPYIKCYLLPDHTAAGKQKTSYKRRNLNPVFEQELTYRVPYSDLQSRTLQVAVWHHATARHNLFMGEVLIPMAGFQMDPVPHWYPVNQRMMPSTPSLQSSSLLQAGQLELALKIVPDATLPSKCELHVWFKSAKNLQSKSGGDLNPFGRCVITPHKSNWSKRKTETMKLTNNPIWDRAIVYRDIDKRTLPQIGLEISILHQGTLNMTDTIGGCRINAGTHAEAWMDASGTEQELWMTMIENPTKWIEGKVRLRTLHN